MKYQWTGWITHVPGQELPSGTYALFEFCGANPYRDGTSPFVPFQVEGMVTKDMRGCPAWKMVDDHGPGYCRIIRYKLRSAAAEEENETTLELVN